MFVRVHNVPDEGDARNGKGSAFGPNPFWLSGFLMVTEELPTVKLGIPPVWNDLFRF